MEFSTLEGIEHEYIRSVFNRSFSDYSIPFQLSQKQFNDRFHAYNFELNFSVGAFYNNELVGFILHGVERRENSIKLYNGGTGVIPSHRGNSLTQKMYSDAIPRLRERGVTDIVLEVISNNKPAIRSYRKVGFNKVRDLNCYKGEIKKRTIEPKLEIKEISTVTLEKALILGSVKPTWQNSFETIARQGDTLLSIGIFSEGHLIGYLVCDRASNRILQIAVDEDHRGKKNGSRLLEFVRAKYSATTSIINVDSRSDNLNHFLVDSGLGLSLNQDEMLLKL